MIRDRQRAQAASGLVLACGPALAGDDDKPPAYKIYIDPETGRYTTEDPALKKEQGSAITVAPDPGGSEAGQVSSLSGVAMTAVIIILLAGTTLWFRRQHRN